MNKTKDNVLIILAKKPVLGKIKTRIAKETSNRFALRLAVASLDDLIHNLSNSNYYDLIAGTDFPEDLEWYERNYNLSGITIEVKQGVDLSDRMRFVFSTLCGEHGYKKVCLIPMDIPFTQMEEVISAFSRLDSFDYVLGPETNGGVYLIGMRGDAYKKKLFNNVAWGTPRSFETLINNFGKNSLYKLKLKDDINTFQDILNNRDIIKTHCAKLYELLKAEGYYLSESNRYIDYDSLNIAVPTVSAVIERKNNGQPEILLQTRHKPSVDQIYSGLLEIPSGLIEKYESAADAVLKEVREETGLDVVISEELHQQERFDGSRNDSLVSYKPFCVVQQLRGGRSYLNLGFVCKLKNQNLRPVEHPYETINPHWVSLRKLKKLIEKNQEKFFFLNVPILKKYLEYKEDESRISK